MMLISHISGLRDKRESGDDRLTGMRKRGFSDFLKMLLNALCGMTPQPRMTPAPGGVTKTNNS